MEECWRCRTFQLHTSQPDDEEEPEIDWAGGLISTGPGNICDCCIQTLKTPLKLSEDFPSRHYLPATVLEAYQNPHLGVGPVPHQLSFDSLRKSALSGCFICRSLVGVLLKTHVRNHVLYKDEGQEPPVEHHPEWFTAARLVTQKFGKLDSLHIDFTHDSSDDYDWWFCPFILVPVAEDGLRKLTNEPNARFIQLVSDTKAWIRQCYCNHSPNQTESWLSGAEEYYSFASVKPEHYPTRLLEILSPSSSDSMNVRLVNTKVRSCDGAYAALSHCWGDANFYVCDETTYDDLKRGVSTKILSKTFRDAIKVTNALGLKYVWIDSLCIIQGNKDDWLLEGALMNRVYSEACITLCATASKGSEGGFHIDEKSPLSSRIIELDLFQPKAKYLVTRPEILQWREEIDQAPLHRRAWVLQERLLSPRLMHFGREQVFLECGHSMRCEAMPQKDKPDSDYAFRRETKINLYSMNSLMMPEPSYTRIWMQLVEAYSARALTYDTDKLIAISALARMVAEKKQEFLYHAGLFQPQIERQLLWAGSGARYKEHVAPTWSWASLAGGVSFSLDDFDPGENEDHFRLLLSVNSVQTEDQLADPFGGCIRSCLLIRGTLLPLAWTDLGCFESTVNFENLRGKVHPVRFKLYPNFDVPENSSRETGCDLRFLPVLIRYQPSENKLYGILLREVKREGLKMPRFERVGFAAEYDSLYGCFGLTGRGFLDDEEKDGIMTGDIGKEREWLLSQRIDSMLYDSSLGQGTLDFLLQ